MASSLRTRRYGIVTVSAGAWSARTWWRSPRPTTTPRWPPWPPPTSPTSCWPSCCWAA